MRVRVCVAVLAAAGWAGAAEAQSRYAEPGQYGGGLIEYLMTGSAPGPRGAQRAAAYGDPLASARRERYAALPASGLYPQGGAYPAGNERQGGLYAQPEPQAEMREERIGRGIDPRFARQEVAYDGPQRPGTIVVDTPNHFLYLVQPGGRAMRYGIGVGRPGFAWAGLKTVSRKAEWPDWIPPAEMLARRPDLPRHMAGGPQNPLGARALYLGSSLYRIHGTNEPHTIGQSVSSGCIRMMNEDVIDLYDRTPVGTKVVVL